MPFCFRVRTCAVGICRAFCILAVLIAQLGVVAPVAALTETGRGEESDGRQETQVAEEVEVPELRTERSRTFVGGETARTEVYNERIFALRGAEYVRINNNLVEVEGDKEEASAWWRNTHNSYSAQFRSEVQPGEVVSTIEMHGARVETSFELQREATGTVHENTIIYNELLPYADVRYTLLAERVKGDIIVNAPEIIDSTVTPFIENIAVNKGTVLKQVSNKRIEVWREGARAWDIMAPIMTDANGAVSSDVQIELRDGESDGKYRIEVTPNMEWLASAVYPVTIDPDTVLDASVTAYVESASPNTATWPQRLMSVGTNTVDGYYKGRTRSYMQFALPPLPPGISQSDITRAEMVLYQYVQYQPYQAVLQPVTSSWAPEHLTYNNQPSAGASIGEAVINGNHHYTWDIRSQLQQWYSNPGSNYGVRIVAQNEGRRGGLFRSQYYPGAPEDQRPHIDIWHHAPNVQPKVPLLGDPVNGAAFGGDGTGQGSSVQLNVFAEDPDDSNIRTVVRATNSTGTVEKIVPGSGWQSAVLHLADGDWTWTAQTFDDTMGGGVSPPKGLRVDTTPPAQPILEHEPRMTAGLQNHIYATSATDSGVGGVTYTYQIATTDDFTENIQEYGTEAASYGFVGLIDDQQYYYRVRAADQLGNSTQWSPVVSSRQDATAPELSEIDVSTAIISPENTDGVLDVATVRFTATDNYFDHSEIVIEGPTSSEVVQTKDSVASVEVGEMLEEGLHLITVHAYDTAGNRTTSNDVALMVDNTAAQIDIAQPRNNVWTNSEALDLYGQSEESADVAITRQQSSYGGEVIVDVERGDLGSFQAKLPLNLGASAFTVTTVDPAGNTNTREVVVHREINTPLVSINAEGRITRNTMRVEFHIEEEGAAEAISGVDLSSLRSAVTDPRGVETTVIQEGGVDGLNKKMPIEVVSADCIPVEEQRYKSCDITLGLPVDEDGPHTIDVYVADHAGNSTSGQAVVERDTEAVLEISERLNGATINTTRTKIEGTAERGGVLDIKVDGRKISNDIDPDKNPNVTGCEPASHPSAREVCHFEIDVEVRDQATSATNDATLYDMEISLMDDLGNTQVVQDQLEVDLSAVEASFTLETPYVSPNNDGVLDIATFTDFKSSAPIAAAHFAITNDRSETVFEQSTEQLPTRIEWDGLRAGSVVQDGVYGARLTVTTTDGITAESQRKTFEIQTEIDDRLVITSPTTGTTTAFAYIDVLGIAPLNTIVMLCDKVPESTTPCDQEYEVEPNDNGLFQERIPLKRVPGNGITAHTISAQAWDQFGNSLESENAVTVYLDTTHPFVDVSASPAIVGINTEEQYEQFLRKELQETEVHMLDLDASVSQQTGPVTVRLSKMVNLSEVADENGLQGGQSEILHVFNESCVQFRCDYHTRIPVPPLEGGQYEVIFSATKGGAVVEVSDIILVDAIQPSTPQLRDVRAYNEHGERGSVRIHDASYVTRFRDIEAVGSATPNAAITVRQLDDKHSVLCETTVSAIGMFYCRARIPEVVAVNGGDTSISLALESRHGPYRREGVQESIRIDQQSPRIEQILSSQQWVHAGMETDVSLATNEAMHRADIEMPSGFIYALGVGSSKTHADAEIAIHNATPEGRMHTLVHVEDIAGNITEAPFVYFVDNTRGHPPEIPIEKVIVDGGVQNTQKQLTWARRMEGYVQSARTITLPVVTERFSDAEVTIDGIHEQQQLNGEDCNKVADDNVVDTVPVLLGTECTATIDIALTEDGGKRVAIRQHDRSANASPLSNDVLVYSDTTAPETPSVAHNTTTYDDHLEMTVYGEPLSDIVVRDNINNPVIGQFSESGVFTTTIALPHIGTKEVELQSVDAAGNQSETNHVRVERKEPIPIIQHAVSGAVRGVRDLINRLRTLRLLKGDVEDRIDRHRFLQQWRDHSKRAFMEFRLDADGNSKLVSSYVAAPLVYDASDNDSFFHIDGVALNKNTFGRVRVQYETRKETFGLCWPFWSCRTVSEWNEIEKDIELRNTKVSLYANTNPVQVAETWNDGDEFWEMNIGMQDQLRQGNTAGAVSVLYGDFDIVIPDRGWVNIDYRQNGWGVSSGKSNILTIGSSTAQLKQQIQDRLGVELRDGTYGWDRDELAMIWKALELLPQEMVDGHSLQFITREGPDSIGCGTSATSSTVAYLPSDGTELHICNFIAKIGSDIEAYRREALASIVHEFVHVYQKNNGGAIAKLPNAGTATHGFYDVLFDNKHAEHELFGPTTEYWAEGREIGGSGPEDFVSRYAYAAARVKPSYSLGIPIPEDLRRPQEFMAEAVTYYYLEPYRLQSHQTFTSSSGERRQYDLYELIKNTIDI